MGLGPQVFRLAKALPSQAGSGSLPGSAAGRAITPILKFPSPTAISIIRERYPDFGIPAPIPPFLNGEDVKI